MKKVLLPVILLTIMVISCKKSDDTTTPVVVDSYMSITANSKWIYDVITNPGPSQTTASDTVTATSTDTSVNSRTYRIFSHKTGAEDYYNITSHDYYRFQNLSLAGATVPVENLYLKDDQAQGISWSQTISLTVPGFPTPIPVTITNSIFEKGITKTVNGTTYTDVITIKTDINSSSLPAGSIATNIKSYYAKKVGLIQGDYSIQIPLAAVNINTQTILKSAVIQ